MNNDNNILVSVIIPCRNYGAFLPATLDSLLAQTHHQWECIIIDNGSTDNTKEVCIDYMSRDQRIRKIETPPKGVSNARNIGLAAAQGQWIQLLDADDLIQPNKIGSQLDEVALHPTIDFIYGPARYFFNDQPSELRHSRHELDRPWMPKLNGKGNPVVRALLRGNIAPIQSPLVRKSLLDKIGYFDETLAGFEDWELFMRLALHGANFAYYESANDYSLVRLHSASASQNNHMMFSHYLPFFQKVIFSPQASLKNRGIALIRYSEEFWNRLLGRKGSSDSPQWKWSNDSFYQHLLLTILSSLGLPLYLVLQIFRKAQKG